MPEIKPKLLVRIIFGRTNDNKTVTAYSDHKHFYKESAKQVIDFCEERSMAYHTKNKTITEGRYMKGENQKGATLTQWRN